MNPYVQYMYSYPHKTAYRPLEGISLKDYGERLAGTGHGLYLHIPFCQTKCGYCNLFSVTGQGQKEMERYLDGVERQMSQYQEILSPYGTEFSDITIGGGTPLLLTEGQLERVFTMLETYFSFSKDREIIIETAPNQTTREKLTLLKQVGVTRVSMGIQSFRDEELHTLGRHHCGQKARDALKLLKSFDFPCINLDFIYGIPGQTTDSLLNSLQEAITYEPDELFLYPLYVKHGAGLTQKVKNGMVLNPERALLQYQEASAFLRSKGFRQDSMRRFSRERTAGKKAALREFSDCGFGTSLALGCGGRSYLGNLHFCTPYAVTKKECLIQLKRFAETEDFTVITHGILLSTEEEKRRYVIRHLFIYPGLEPKKYEKQFQSPVFADFPLLKKWIQMNWLKWIDVVERTKNPMTAVMQREKKTYLAPTEEGLALSDYLGPQLISSEIHARMEEWEVIHGK